MRDSLLHFAFVLMCLAQVQEGAALAAEKLKQTSVKSRVFTKGEIEWAQEYIPPITAASQTLPMAKVLPLVDAREYAPKALRLLSTVHETDLNRSLVHALRGWAYASLSRHDEAAQEFDQCTDFSQTCPRCQSLAARSFMNVEKYDKAIALLTQLLSTAKKNSGGWLDLRAECYMAKGERSKAVADYVREAGISIEKRRTYLAKAADVYRIDRKYKQALDVLQLGEKEPEQQIDTPYYACRGFCMAQLGRYNEAIKDLTSAINLARRNINKKALGPANLAIARLYKDRADCYAHQGKNDLAQKDLKELQRLSTQTESEIFGLDK